MPKKLKLKDWQDQARQANPEMFDPPPLTIVEPVKSPLAKKEATPEQKVGIMKRVFGWGK